MSCVQFSTEIYNPSNPIEVPVKGFTYGQRLRVVLKPTDKKDKKFYINLKNGDDIIVHFNPRLKDEALVFNSFYQGSWQYEERASVVFPFKKNEIYTIEFVATGQNSVTVHLNGMLLYEFKERQSGWSVSSIEVGGDVFVHSIHIG
uniref:Galectin n=1 Tax=Haemonchus contortus TaxID=6289 RepID=A0A7I5E8C5_HAECO|nr:Galectin domain containing protein [Haemonchus contortus]